MLRKRQPKARSAEQALDAGAATRAAVTLLARRDFCCAELRGKLLAEGFAEEAVATVLDDLLQRHYIDDARYAQQYATYRAQRGHGPLRIARDLGELGLGAELIESALEAYGDWASLAREVRIRRFGLKLPQEWAEKARQARFLQYRGFSNDHIRSALGADATADSD